MKNAIKNAFAILALAAALATFGHFAIAENTPPFATYHAAASYHTTTSDQARADQDLDDNNADDTANH